MDLSVFIKYQNQGKSPFMCIDLDHAMPLVPYKTDDLNIELRCFVNGCEFKIIPGLSTYNEILKENYE